MFFLDKLKKIIKFWDVRTARCVRTVNNSYPQTSVVVMEDGINCLYGGTDGVISVYIFIYCLFFFIL